MRLAVLCILFVVVAADIYIYRSVISSHCRRLAGRLAYIVFAVLTDTAAIAGMVYYSLIDGDSSKGAMVMMWLLWTFLFAASAKLMFVLGSFLDWLLWLVFRKKIHPFRWFAVAIWVVVAVAMIWGTVVGRERVVVNEVTVSSERLPSRFDGYRIAMFSDVHFGTLVRPAERISDIVDIINSLDADLVVNGGDIVNISYLDFPTEVAPELSRIKARDGVVSVWGNHDLGFYIGDSLSLPPVENVARLGELLDGLGWRTLCDQTVYVHRGHDSIAVSGLNYPNDKLLNGHNVDMAGVDLSATFEGVPAETYNVVVSHTPLMWEQITDAGYGDLTLSGHVHAMQVKFRLFGRWFSPARLIYDEWSGLYENGDNRYLYINDGVGCVGYPMRIGAWSEITLITLEKCE
jgi:predicted MPP superfamily phosphohydrolase